MIIYYSTFPLCFQYHNHLCFSITCHFSAAVLCGSRAYKGKPGRARPDLPHFFFLQHMDRRRVEDQTAGVAHLINVLVLGVVLLELDEGVAHHDVVVLVGAHEAAQHHLAGQAARVCQGRGLGAENDGVFLALLHVVASFDPEGVAASPMKSATNSLTGW